MKTPIITFSDNILIALSWFMSIGGITLFPFIILRKKYRDDPRYRDRLEKTINHESIHIKQQQEIIIPSFVILIILNFIVGFVSWWLIPVLGYLSFYVWYVLEWVFKLFKYGTDSYRNISFEREAYINETNPDYLKTRIRWNFFKYIFKK